MTIDNVPRVSIVVSHPIQYFTPLFNALSKFDSFELDVVYGNDAGVRSQYDPGFDLNHSWDIDLVSGHSHRFISQGDVSRLRLGVLSLYGLFKVTRGRDLVVIHGYTEPVSIAAVLVCWVLRVPYLLRMDTSERAKHPWFSLRSWWPRLVARLAHGGLAVGQRNMSVLRGLGVRDPKLVRFAIDDARFRQARVVDGANRRIVRETLGLPADAVLVVYAGKFVQLKGVHDLLAAVAELDVHLVCIGDGVEMSAMRDSAPRGKVTFTGFKNQTEIPAYLGVADVVVLPSHYEPWGLIINEAMAAGCVPVTSDAVGCSPDLVEGVGWVHRPGDVDGLRVALQNATKSVGSADVARRVSERVAIFSLRNSVADFELALVGYLGARD